MYNGYLLIVTLCLEHYVKIDVALHQDLFVCQDLLVAHMESDVSRFLVVQFPVQREKFPANL